MARKGKGAKIWLWDSSIATPALVKLGELTSVTPPGRTRDTIDTTHHESTGDYREFLSALIDAGEVTFTLNHDPGSATDLLLEMAFTAGDVRSFAIDVNKAPVANVAQMRRIAGSCIVTAYTPGDVVIDDKMTVTITLKVSGPLTFSVAP